MVKHPGCGGQNSKRKGKRLSVESDEGKIRDRQKMESNFKQEIKFYLDFTAYSPFILKPICVKKPRQKKLFFQGVLYETILYSYKK